MADTGFPDGAHVERHRDGSVRARGPVVDGQPHGYWEWFRLDGTLLRSGHFDAGRNVGDRPARAHCSPVRLTVDVSSLSGGARADRQGPGSGHILVGRP